MQDPWSQFIDDNEAFFAEALPGRFTRQDENAAGSMDYASYPPDNAA